MLVFRDNSVIPQSCFGSAIALGNFDGVHLGHQEVIRKAIFLAKQAGKPVGILTFEPHPRRVFKPDLPPLRIVSFSEKSRILQESGVDFIRVIHFTKKFAETTAEAFVKNILVGQLRVAHVVTGDDFVFGHNREGNVGYMQQMAASEGFSYTLCPQITVGGERCSSTRIRQLLALGKVDEVSLLLGRAYSITGIVRAGDKRGRELGYPTANVFPGRMFIPATGVYAVRVRVHDKLINGVANLGTRPTFAGNRVRLETHLFDWNKDIYREHIEVTFVKYLRAERKFDGIELLKAQIAEDCREAQMVLNSYKM
jgi:riboflavin kinase/FMN adenylyltransferase